MQEKPTVNPSLRSLNRTDEPLPQHKVTMRLQHCGCARGTSAIQRLGGSCSWGLNGLSVLGLSVLYLHSGEGLGRAALSRDPDMKSRSWGWASPVVSPPRPNALPQCSELWAGHSLVCSIRRPLARSLPHSLSLTPTALSGTHGV